MKIVFKNFFIKTLLLCSFCLLFLVGCSYNQSNNDDTINKRYVESIEFTEQEKKISKMAFDDFVGFKFSNLIDGELEIKLIGNGKLLQNYETIVLIEPNPLNCLMLGTVRNESTGMIDVNLYYNFDLGSFTYTKVGEVNVSDILTPNYNANYWYIIDDQEISDSKFVLGALCIENDYFIKNDVDMDEFFKGYSQYTKEDFYQKISDDLGLGLEYCLLITLNQYKVTSTE